MTKYLLTIFITLFFSNKIVSQTKYLDSIHRNKVYYFKNLNNDSLFYYSKKLQQSNNKLSKVIGLSAEAYIYHRQKKYKKAEEAALKLIEKTNYYLNNSTNEKQVFLEAKVSGLNRLFWIKKNQEDYTQAYEYLIQMQKTNEQHPNKKHNKYLRYKINIKASKAIIKQALKMDIEAKKILLSAYKDSNSGLLKKLNDNTFFLQQKADILNSLGNTYISINRNNSLKRNYNRHNNSYLDSASYYYDKAFEITKLFNPPHEDSEIIYNFRKTEVFMARKEFSKAIDLINNYKNISNGYPYFHREYFQKAICFHNLKKPDSAIYYSNKLLKNHKKCETSKLITIYDILSKEYNNLNKLDSAYKYSKLTLDQYNLAKNTKDKTFNLFYNNNFEQAQQLNKTIEKREAKKQRNLIISFIVLLLTFIIITFYLLNKEKEKKKELILIMNKNKPTETERKEYNIDEALENKILHEFKNVTESLDFLKPDFSINYIAEKLDTNTTYISFVFNKHHDESFKQYCTKLKINYVVEKLKTDKNFRKYSIQAIAEEIGYTNASAFTRAFKKHIGITPSAFLKNIEN
ncbi:helix-turn-helix domain-containing protein [Tenacibaculum larymnensis]|uniref:Helix-turn-helix domain-containing protein n=1 Tax=Tenacibaculum larymnensis TaxID=2878201 RepID=A0A9X4IM65_9FLAO|nr:helix-turn-helix domain-containing protein [Tenacibaculum larymnensis]MDE1207323.1 helix-turn-helix domain-containing protein [Tenacibaculum larymnensis]